MALCPCHSGRDLADCCGPFRVPPGPASPTTPEGILQSFRTHLIALIEDSAALQEVWFAFLDENVEEGSPEPQQQLMLDHFLWDWFKKYSEARPLMRIVRAWETEDLRMANRLDQWSLSAWEPWRIDSVRPDGYDLSRLGTDKICHVRRALPNHGFSKGDGILARILPHHRESFLGLGVSHYPGAAGCRRLAETYGEILGRHGLTLASHMRPDVHNEAWFPVHRELFRTTLQAPKPRAKRQSTKVDQAFLDAPVPDLGGQTPREAARHAFGQHRLKRWSLGLPPEQRAAVDRLLD